MTEAKKQKILIVDDEMDLRETLQDVLLAEGFEVSLARDGEEGLKMALDERPDLIMLDIMLPDITGHEVLQKLRDDEWGANVKVILLTALDDMESIRKGLENESNDYVIKAKHSLEEIVEKVRHQTDRYA